MDQEYAKRYGFRVSWPIKSLTFLNQCAW
jgi:hypothetical protein